MRIDFSAALEVAQHANDCPEASAGARLLKVCVILPQGVKKAICYIRKDELIEAMLTTGVPQGTAQFPPPQICLMYMHILPFQRILKHHDASFHSVTDDTQS